jgi:hypothetical protein
MVDHSLDLVLELGRQAEIDDHQAQDETGEGLKRFHALTIKGTPAPAGWSASLSCSLLPMGRDALILFLIVARISLLSNHLNFFIASAILDCGEDSLFRDSWILKNCSSGALACEAGSLK